MKKILFEIPIVIKNLKLNSLIIRLMKNFIIIKRLQNKTNKNNLNNRKIKVIKVIIKLS